MKKKLTTLALVALTPLIFGAEVETRTLVVKVDGTRLVPNKIVDGETCYEINLDDFDFTTLTAAQCQDLFQCIVDQGSPAQFDAFCTALGLTLTISTGPDGVVANATQSEDLELCAGETIHFYSQNNSILFTITNGSVIVGAEVDPAILTAIENNTTNIASLQLLGHPDDDIETVTGSLVDNADPRNPVINVPEICTPMPLSQTGPFSNPTITEFEFTPTPSGEYTFELEGFGILPTNGAGNAWLNIGTTSGTLPNGSSNTASFLGDRIDSNTPLKNYDVELTSGVTYYLTVGAGGGDSVDNVTLQTVSCPPESLTIPPPSVDTQLTKAVCEIDTLAALSVQNNVWELGNGATTTTSFPFFLSLPDTGSSARQEIEVIAGESYTITASVRQLASQNINNSEIITIVYDSDGASILGSSTDNPQNSIADQVAIFGVVPTGNSIFIEYTNASPTTAILESLGTIVEGPQVVRDDIVAVCSFDEFGNETRLGLFADGLPYTTFFSIRDCPEEEEKEPCCVLDYGEGEVAIPAVTTTASPANGGPGDFVNMDSSFTFNPAVGETVTLDVAFHGGCGEIPARISVTRISAGGVFEITADGRLVNQPGTGDYTVGVEILPDAFGRTFSPRWIMLATGVNSNEPVIFLASNPLTSYAQGPGGANISSLPYIGSWSNNNNSNTPSGLGFDASSTFTYRDNGAASINKVLRLYLRDVPVDWTPDTCEIVTLLGEAPEPPQFTLEGAFADDAAAGVAGVLTGEYYQTDGTGAAPLNAAGIVMVKQ